MTEAPASSSSAALQVPYALTARDVERELVPMAGALEPTVTAWSALGGGLLTGRYGSDRERPQDTRIATALGTMGALDLELSADELAALEQVSAIESGFPNDFGGRAMAYGDTLDRIEPHRHVIWPDLLAAADEG